MNGKNYSQPENGTVAMNNRIPLQSLTAANIMVEGSIIGYKEVTSNPAGSAQDISVLARRYATHQLDEAAVNLRVVSLSVRADPFFGEHQ